MPILNKAITRTPRGVVELAVEPAVFTLNWASATGQKFRCLAGGIGGMLLGFTPANLF